MPISNIDKDLEKRIKSGKKKLKAISKELKSHFCGINTQIDRITKSIETWYCCPELLTHPVTIMLVGCTGVGKTDLVRRLVKLLNFSDRFCEIEMMNKGSSSTYPWMSSISSILASNPKIESGKPVILLLDEIQNFRTIDEDGHELPEYKYRDIWTLLSDGKLPFKVEMDYMIKLLWDMEEQEKQEKESKERGKTNSPNTLKSFKKNRRFYSDNSVDDDLPFNNPSPVSKKFQDDNTSEDDDEDIDYEEEEELSDDQLDAMLNSDRNSHPSYGDFDEESGKDYHSLKHFKIMLRLKEPIEEIATWSMAKKKSVIISKINDQQIYEELDYTKALIFISGNIDEAYEFSKQTSEVDVDADIFHDLSLKINILDIKKALNSRFKPEQIARFGNIQIIYPTLSKKSYESIIERKIESIVKNVKDRFGINIMVDKSINSIIYNNGVFPTQGTRPVFSTITEILESPLPPFILGALSNKKDSIEIFYKNHNICAKIGNKIHKFPYDGVLEKLKEDRNRNINKRALNAVHEAGHSVAYALLFKLAPPQTSALTASSDIGGFVWVHNICGSKALLEDKICAVLAGGAAERMVFGKENATWGLQDDLKEATKYVGSMAKHYGMLDFNSFIMHPQRSDVVNTDVNGANPIIEAKMTELLNKTEDLLRKNIALFQDTVDFLLNNNNMTPEDFLKICNNHGLKIRVQNSEEVIYADYSQRYLDFKTGKS